MGIFRVNGIPSPSSISIRSGRPSTNRPLEALKPDSLEDMKQELFHIGTKEYGLDLCCENIFVKDDVLFLLVSLRNDSAESYSVSSPRFAVESKRRTRRGLQYEKAVFPRQSYGLGTVTPSSEARMVFTFDKQALLRGQVLRVYIYEDGGARNLVTLQRRKAIDILWQIAVYLLHIDINILYLQY